MRHTPSDWTSTGRIHTFDNVISSTLPPPITWSVARAETAA